MQHNSLYVQVYPYTLHITLWQLGLREQVQENASILTAAFSESESAFASDPGMAYFVSAYKKLTGKRTLSTP